MENEAVHKSYLESSDFLAGMSVLAAATIEYFVPTSFYLERTAHVLLGVVILLLAWVIIYFAKREFKRHAEESRPGVPTKAIIETGIFRYSRNPMYVGVALLPVAFGLIFDSVWVAASAVISIILFHLILILPEEQYLEKKFGTEYEAYKRGVRRWF